ncbi:uncharacterized protein I303_101318 [Kwoniella dejecticola CBS 10117]|uniref:Ser-Thr-rich glycosyl-phosphatidyl-inositol-anchored membrane family-domain-containing protein n=1 Tax=Kwoniella dejecticola CBS 10117 TaxID=1296121 RepID=A0A1A6AHG2_9TREE|nr:uncharacterized protein I303_01327 [Kwoniella dejecticola CBS 10117]OBR89499.1 hypothetical protein I303_01327 [Kwoniella dejecticola CBS 10117]
MLFTKLVVAALSLTLTPVVLSAPTLVQRQQTGSMSGTDSVQARPDSGESVITNRPVPTATATGTAEEDPSPKPSPDEESSVTRTSNDENDEKETPSSRPSVSASASASNSPSATRSESSKPSATETKGLHYTNKFPSQVKNGDTVKLEWDGGEGPYLVYTILQYAGLTTPQPYILERSLDDTSYEVTVNEDDSHDRPTVTFGIASNRNNNEYKRVTIPLSK